MPERYSTATLLAMQEEIEAPTNFLTKTFFGREINFQTQVIEFDIQRRGRRLAPFVAPTVAGKPMRREGFVTKTFKPAYVKPKTYVDPTRPLVRMAGEAWGGDLSPAQRWDRLMTEDLALHKSMLENRLEWMSASAIVTGTITIDGEDFPKAVVDFGLDSGLNVALAGTATWDLTTSKPLRDIEQLAILVRKKSYGAIARTVIMDSLAWSLFKEHADVKDLLDLNYKRKDQAGTEFDLGIRNNMYGGGSGAELVGRVAGRFEIYVYEGYYEDDDGVTQQHLPDYTVIVAAPAEMQGAQYYGAILDKDANWQPLKQHFKSRSMWDPAGEELLSQSAPLVAPGRMNTWAVLTVA